VQRQQAVVVPVAVQRQGLLVLLRLAVLLERPAEHYYSVLLLRSNDVCV
jgi:hypothetical protein